jgi:C4-dicarboxylate-specific signal transduction histidine kinase
VATMGQLSVSIAHEVNQPIAAALTNAETALPWLDRGPPDLEEVRLALGRVVKDASRAGDVIAGIRALIGKGPPQHDRVDRNAAIREVVELTRGEATKHGVEVRQQLADGLPPIYGDRVQLQQVALNLIFNTIEAMSGLADGPRQLRIGSGIDAASCVLIAVNDSGPGLDPASLERLFDAFYTTKPNGMGMGLSIRRSIIEAHGGRIWATANEPRGATFQVTLPCGPSP